MHSEGQGSRIFKSASASRETMQSGLSGLLTAREAAEILGVQEQWIWTLTARGLLTRTAKRGKWHLYRRSDVEALAAERRRQFERLKKFKSKRRVRA